MPTEPPQTSDLARAVQDVAERAQLIVREEIELAKVEMTTKATKFAKGAAAAAAASVFLIGALIYGLHSLAWLLLRLLDGDTYDIWVGFAIVTAMLVGMAALAGFLAYRFVKKALPPSPTLAVEEAQLIRETVKTPPGPAPRRLEGEN